MKFQKFADFTLTYLDPTTLKANRRSNNNTNLPILHFTPGNQSNHSASPPPSALPLPPAHAESNLLPPASTDSIFLPISLPLHIRMPSPSRPSMQSPSQPQGLTKNRSLKVSVCRNQP